MTEAQSVEEIEAQLQEVRAQRDQAGAAYRARIHDLMDQLALARASAQQVAPAEEG